MTIVLSPALRRVDFISIAFWLFALSVVLLPIGFGGNRPLPFGLMQGALALSYFFLALARPVLWMPKRLLWALVLFSSVLIWAFLQTQFSFLAPHPVWLEAEKTLGVALHKTIALSPEDAMKGLTRLLTYFATGFLAWFFGRDARRARQMVKLMWFSGVALCAYGLGLHILGVEKILWLDKWAYRGDVTATFVNHNHFGLFAGLVMLCGGALLVQSWRGAAHARDWIMKKGARALLLLFIVALALVFSHSRAGLVFSLMGLGIYFLCLVKNRRHAFIAGLAAGLALTAFLVFAMHVLDRFPVLLLDHSSRERGAVYDITVRAIADRPLSRYGLNGFQPAFRLYQENMRSEFNHAHSDILESLLDLGLVFGFMLWGGIALLVMELLRGLRRRQGRLFPALGLAATLTVLLHASVDFPLQIPAVVLYWVTLLGIGLAQRRSRFTEAPSTSGRAP